MYLFVSSDPDSNVYNIGLMRSIMGNALESVSPSRLRALAPRYGDTKIQKDIEIPTDSGEGVTCGINCFRLRNYTILHYGIPYNTPPIAEYSHISYISYSPRGSS